MGIFDKLFKGKPAAPVAPEQAVLIRLNGTTLLQHIYDENDLSTLENQLIAALEGTGAGEFDGNEIGPEVTRLYLYGPDAEKLFMTIKPVFSSYPLCQQSTVIIRQGKPGAQQREVIL
jgi:hypothetical protein